MIKEVKIETCVWTWHKEHFSSSMKNPLNKTFKDFVFEDDIIACQFDYTSPMHYNLDYTRPKGPHLFIGSMEEANKYPIRHRDGKNYVFFDNREFEIISGAKFASKEKAKQLNMQGFKTNDISIADFISKEICLRKEIKEAGSPIITSSQDAIGTRENMPKTLNIGKDVANIQIVEKYIGSINLSNRHKNPLNPDFKTTQKVAIDLWVDITPEICIGTKKTLNDLKQEYPNNKITKEMEEKNYYQMANGNIRAHSKNEKVITLEQLNKIYQKIVKSLTEAPEIHNGNNGEMTL